MSDLSLITPLINELSSHLLSTDPTTLERLAKLQGKVIALELEATDIKLYMLPGAGGIELLQDWDGAVDVHMIGKPSELIKMGLAAKSPLTPGRISLRIEGDLHVGQQFKRILDDMQIDFEELLSRFIGDSAAYHAGRLARSVGRRIAYMARSAADDGSEYLRFEAEILPADWRVREYIDAVDRLRDDVDRLAMRVDRLRRSINS
jgi:ubiquinone biosynthesis protein UbiJ